MKEKNYLPTMGVGPIYVISIILITALGIILSLKDILNSGKIEYLKLLFIIIGVTLIIIGVFLWINAVFQSKIDNNIKNNTLVTTGVYSYVRNPIYSAFFLICTGILLLFSNLWLLILPIIYWIYMTILMKNTEEKWLENLYGDEYLTYKKRVNRCIPWKYKN